MKELLQQELLEFIPISGRFDIDAVTGRISEIGFSFRDEAEQTRFVVTPDPQSRDEFQAARRADPDSSFPYVLLIDVEPDRIVVSPSTFQDVLPLSRQFIAWLLQNYRCRILNEEGTDVSALAAPAG